ncbi:CapA family protein [Oceanobacillus sojae]|uniref:Capsular polysaccharide biosynthesis protein n=1 Tax=Oceanobacillus sojae TaxID=582851 RepID=A0A511ZFS4_9BACI|nr:CapA family protein [Oceanobacillus sojae]GEN86251.1 capsular polysaccharide biosynthesis protein [Oceanobacillus sojae]
MYKFKFFISFLLFFFLLTACTPSPDNNTGSSHSMRENSQTIKETDEIDPKVTVAAIGDILIHDRVYDDAWDGEKYDFKPMLAEVADYLKEPEITIANQETIMGGESIGLSGYPNFNSPFEIGDDLQDAGVDIVTMANNHTLDRGEEAIQNAIAYYKEISMPYTGSFQSKEDQSEIRVLETDQDISVAFLSYTYGTNGMPIPDGKPYLVNLIDREQIKEEVEKANELADVTIVSLHFGVEEERTPNQDQADLAQYAADLGVDVVIGNHPHVLQPVEWLEGKEGNKTLVAYSLGNFLSGQYQFYNRIGGIFEFDLVKEEDEVRVKAPRFLPTFVEFEEDGDTMSNIQVVPLEKASEEQIEDLDEVMSEIKSHMTQWMPELEWIGLSG